MKKSIFLLFLVIIMIIFYGSKSLCETERVTIIGTEDDKLYVAQGGNIVINAGKNIGIIKGDLISIYKKDDRLTLVDEIGKCVIIKVENNKSTCQIIKSKIEVGKGDYVFLKKLEYSDPHFYPAIYATLNELVEPYKNHEKIKVYVHNIYDEKNNITELSEMIREEILNIFKKKERLAIDTMVLSEYMNFQDHYFYSDIDRSKQENISNLKDKMKQFNINAVITGYYTIKNDNLILKLFLIDRDWEDKSIKIFTTTKDYSNKIARIIKPYKPFKEKEFVDYKFVLNIKDYLPDSDEQREIIRLESEKELNFRYKFTNSKLKFNRISPSDINVKINDDLIRDIQRGEEYEKKLEKGKKRILVSFIPVLYDNDIEMFSLKKEIKKEILVDLNDEKDIYIEIFLDSTYGKEFADIKVVRKKFDEKIRLRPVKTVIERQPTIELYRD